MAKKRKRQMLAATASSGAKPRTADHTHPSGKLAKAPTRVPSPTIPFDAEDRILLVGEGDFSFAKALVEEHGCCDVTATCFDGKELLFEKYAPQAREHVEYLDDVGQTVLYGVDATKLESAKGLKNAGLFDRIGFNFPHVGGKTKDVNRQVRFNQELLVNFFASAIPFLASEGTIIVTLFEGEPYLLWNIRDLARHSGLEVQRSFAFVALAYPGYSHARTLGNVEGGGGWKGEDRAARSYVFQRRGALSSSKSGQAKKKRKREGDADSGDEDGN